VAVILLLWVKPFFRSIEYVIDDCGVTVRKGVVTRRQVTVPFGEITRVDADQGPIERCLGIGCVDVYAASDDNAAHVNLRGLTDNQTVRGIILDRVTALQIQDQSEK
jgi:membrane protein YdbS with pleckstrin-like domain